MKTLLVLGFLGLALGGGADRLDFRPEGMQGAWQAVEVTMSHPVPRTIKPGPNLSIFTAGHYSRTSVTGEQPLLPDVRNATADELRATWGPFVGEAGTYDMSERLITLRPIAAKNPAAVGSSIVYSYKWLDRDTLLVTIVSDRNGAVAHPETIKLIRVE